jgi:HK97 family phage portal protein
MSLASRIGDKFLSLFQRGYNSPGSNVASWLYGAGTATPHEPFAGAWQENLQGAASAGPNILAFGAVYSCVNIISSDIARMPVRVLRHRDGGGREEFRNHPAWRLMRRPNSFQTSLQFIQHYLISKLTTGNTYVLLLRDGRGVVNEMFVLDPKSVQVLVSEEGGIYYRVGKDTLAGMSGPITLPARDILHDRAATFWHPLVGVSPLFAAGVSAMTGARIMMHSERFFGNMARAGGALVAPGKIEPDVAKRLQTEWENNYGAKGLGKTAVLSNGLEFKPITINAVDAELVNQLRWTVEDVARVYRVPGFKLGDLNKVSYRNSEQMARDYFQGCLSYHIEAFEQAMDLALELPEGVEVEFDLAPLFRMETDTRYTAHKTALNAGFKSINEVRQEEDLPPVKGGEEPRVQMQYLPLSMADGTLINAPGQAPGGAPAPEPDDEDEDDDEAKAIDPEQLEAAVVAFMQRLTGDNHHGA